MKQDKTMAKVSLMLSEVCINLAKEQKNKKRNKRLLNHAKAFKKLSLAFRGGKNANKRFKKKN